MKYEGLTQAQLDAQEAARKEAEALAAAKAELDAIDAEAIRPLLAITAGIGTKADQDKIEELAEKAKATRGLLKKASC